MVTGPATWKGQEQVRQGGECWFIGRGFAIRVQETCSCMRREACKPRQRGGGGSMWICKGRERAWYERGRFQAQGSAGRVREGRAIIEEGWSFLVGGAGVQVR